MAARHPTRPRLAEPEDADGASHAAIVARGRVARLAQMVEVQMDKLRICGLDGLFNCIIISEAVKHRKPDVKIFEAALKALMVSPEDAVFVGDSWANDIVPAASLGMRAVWLNRYGATCIDPSIAMEIHSLSDEKLAIILE